MLYYNSSPVVPSSDWTHSIMVKVLFACVLQNFSGATQIIATSKTSIAVITQCICWNWHIYIILSMTMCINFYFINYGGNAATFS